MMDLHHLESDELELEFNIRKLDPTGISALENLTRIIIDEQSGARPLPILPPFYKTSSDITSCKRKLSQIESARLDLADPVDESALSVLRSRALHLIGRLERLVCYDLENRALAKILEDARKLWERLVPPSLVDGEENSSVEEELAGFTASGSAIPSTSKKDSSAQSSPTGTIPKQTGNTRANQQQPGAQLPTWNIDPSIIRTGRASAPSGNNAVPVSAFQAFVSSAAQSVPNEPPAVPLVGNLGVNVAQGRNRAGLTHTLSKWTVRFGGGVKDLAVDEFFFRVENLATADNVHADSLVLGLHCLLTGNASDFYWVQRRKYPNHTWGVLKRSMIAHFARQETDLEIRKLIMDRHQGFKEEFGEFSLAVECLAARMIRPMGDQELMEILRQNMSPKLQTCLLMYPTLNVDSLKAACRKFERLWATQSEASKDRRITSRMAELGFNETPQVEAVSGPNYGQMNVAGSNRGYGEFQEPVDYNVAALAHARQIPNRCEYMVCWNCDDIGHSFGDCTSPDRRVFCYGCGTKNAYKPSCTKCNPGNPKPSGINPGQSRSTPNPFTLTRSGPSPK